MLTKSAAHISSTLLTITRRRVKSLFIGLCNSSASFSCPSPHSTTFSIFWNTKPKFLFRIYRIPSKKMPPSSVPMWNYIQWFYHLYVGHILKLSVVLANTAFHIMLHCNGICATSWLVPYFQDLSSIVITSIVYGVDYMVQCIYALVMSIHFWVLVIFLLLCVYLITHEMDQIWLSQDDPFLKPI